MADVSNVVTDILPRLFGMVAATVRENSVLPRLVMNLSDSIAGKPGQVIQIPDQITGVTRDVAPDATSADPAAFTASTTALTLGTWREAPFVIDDKEAAEILEGSVPRIVEAYAVKLAEYIDAQGMAVYPGIYNTGVSDAIADGTTPVPSAFTVDATKNPTGLRAWNESNVLLSQWGAPNASRRVVLSAFDTGAALINSPFLKADERGDQGGIIDGEIGRKLGQDWWMDQAIPTHTSGTLATTAAQAVKATGVTAGDTSEVFDGTITTGLTVKVGDIFKFADHNQTYVNNTLVTTTTSALTITSFSPPAKQAVADEVAVEFLPSHKVNLLFHPDAIAFASRPLGGIGAGTYIQRFDEVSGLNLRVEISRQNKRDLVSIDALFGWKLRDAKLISRIASIV
jgi:coat protein Gp5